MDASPEGVGDRIAAVHADGWGRLVATLIRFTGDWSLAEECAQDAFARALLVWPKTGVPDQPLAWLTTTGRNRAVDVIRRAAVESRKLEEAATMPEPEPVPAYDGDIPDERLELIFTCCHPALNTEAQVVLTLRTLAGLSTAEIARAFLVSEKTTGQRLFRAKQRIKHTGIPFRVPPAHLLPERLGPVLHVLYLLFNADYGDPTGRVPAEAVRLARLLVELMPDEPEARGLLALMLLHDARRAARTDASGDLVPLEEQDRRLWDAAMIAEGEALLERALRRTRVGPYQLQAAIAACHATAPSAADTDWTQIAELYARLVRLVPSPVVRLNQAVAIGMARTPEAALGRLDELAAEGGLEGYHLLPAARADMLRRAGRMREAAEAYRAAVESAPTEAERRFLRRRMAEVGGGEGE